MGDGGRGGGRGGWWWRSGARHYVWISGEEYGEEDEMRAELWNSGTGLGPGGRWGVM